MCRVIVPVQELTENSFLIELNMNRILHLIHGIQRVISGINRLINGISWLINGITRSINGITRFINGIIRLIHGWGARLGPCRGGGVGGRGRGGRRTRSPGRTPQPFMSRVMPSII